MKKKLATVWLDGCSGCHMSFLDMDERLIDLAEQFDLVYSPIVDHKIFPQGVDISLVEGSVSTDADEHKIRMVRERTKMLVSLGDCAVTGNVPAMRNAFTVSSILERAFGDAPAAAGVVARTGAIGYLSQDPSPRGTGLDGTALAHVLSARGLDAASSRLEELHRRMADDASPRNVRAYSEAEDSFRNAGGYAADVSPGDLKHAGDRLLVKAGERVPSDDRRGSVAAADEGD